MEITPGYKTTEFWLTLLTNIGGLLVMTHVISVDASNQLSQTVQAVAAAIVNIMTLISYFKARTEVKLGALRFGKVPSN